MVVGIVGIEGIVARMLGSEVADRGGSVIVGTVGMVGIVGIGKDDGIWVVGIGGNVGFGKVGIVAIVGSGGNVAWGMVGIAGNGGMLTLGRDGTAGAACRRLRAAKVIWMLESDNAMTRDATKFYRKAAIV
ncbi:hypothetical protein Vadar_017743 [Vaccinium darrowii]|uniref:Uncharacterized protein n=1 Tax=Vaccinium darrowii TaxID=229202 RepID=A0ACB7YEU1_9ERIC|nr:hypothetical protein Vadar_017743 [Vaccinium darrowii]